MKIVKVLIMAYLLVGVLGACHNRKNRKNDDLLISIATEVKIPLNGEQAVDFNELWEIVSINKLETLSSSLVGLLKKVIVTDSKVYLLSSGHSDNIKIFDLEGKFLQSLSRSGGGPSEFIVIEDFFVGGNGEIEIMDSRGKKMIVYDESLNFVNEKSLPFFAFHFTKSDNFYWFYAGTSYNEKKNFKLIVLDSSLTTIEKQYFSFDESEMRYLNFTDQTNFGLYDNKIHFQYSYNDTIYQIERDGLKRYKYINFDNKNMPEKFKSENYIDVVEFLEKCKPSNYAYWIDGYTESANICLFSFTYKDKRYHSYLKRSGDTIVGNTINNYLGIDGYSETATRFNLPIFSNGDYFYYFINAFELQTKVRQLFLNGGLTKRNTKNNILDLIESSDPNDNPIIIKLKARN